MELTVFFLQGNYLYKLIIRTLMKYQIPASSANCVFCRHGRKHTVMPTDINYRANIHALKQEGCTHVVVTTACGSLQAHYKPGDLVFPDQFIDRTTKRASTFYDGKEGSLEGVCHAAMHEPYCPLTRQVRVMESNICHTQIRSTLL